MRFVLFVLVIFSYINVNAQFHAGEFGLGFITGRAHFTKNLGSDPMNVTAKVFMNGFTWYPKYHIKVDDKASLSIGSPMQLGTSGSRYAYVDMYDKKFPIGVDLPLTLDFNFGFGANKTLRTPQQFGCFLGAGYSYTYATITRTNYYNGIWDESEYFEAESSGLMIHAGFRWKIANPNIGVSLRAFYKNGKGDEPYKFKGLALYFVF